MAFARFGPCPHCQSRLSFLEGIHGGSMNPECPRCRKIVTVSRATFLMADYSRPAAAPKKPAAGEG